MSSTWYYKKGGKQHGPVVASMLKSLAMAGRILPDDLVRKADTEDWKRASNVRGLFDPAAGTTPVGAESSTGLKVKSGGVRSSGNHPVDDTQRGLPPVSKRKWRFRILSFVVVFAGLLIWWPGFRATASTLAKRTTDWFLVRVATEFEDTAPNESPHGDSGIMVSLDGKTTSTSKDQQPEDRVADGRGRTSEPIIAHAEEAALADVMEDTGKLTSHTSVGEPQVVSDSDADSDADPPSVIKKPADGKDGTDQVIGEGVGTSADEALKDAYRNAVRQTVGAVVDAETLVENDEVIDDKILTYSDGFIKSYEEIPGSKKFKNGLHRIRIKAQVERRSVIAKLQAANVTLKQLDGQGLFAEAMTQLDAEADAAKLLTKQFEGFPQSCVTAVVMGGPEIIEKSSREVKFKITVKIEPDLEAFKSFADKLVPILEKIASDRGEFTAKFVESETGVLVAERNTAMVDYGRKESSSRDGSADWEWMRFWMPKAFGMDEETRRKHVSIAVATSQTKAAKSIDFKYFILDKSLAPALKNMATRIGECKLQFLDADDGVIISDRFGAFDEPDAHDVFSHGTVVSRMSFEERFGSGYTTNRNVCLAPVFGIMRSNEYEEASRAVRSHRRTIEEIRPYITVSRVIAISPEELKSIHEVRVEIVFQDIGEN